MRGIKRLGFYLFLNILVLTMISLILTILGVNIHQTSGLLVYCALYGFLGSFISLLLSKSAAKSAYKIQLVNSSHPDPRVRELYATVNAMAQERGIKMPELGIYPSQDLNAFATGATRNNSLMAFSSRMLEMLSEEELAAVAGHEMTHITEGDMVSMTLVMGLVNTFATFMARIIAAVLDAALRGDRKSGRGLGSMSYWLVVMILQNVLMFLAMIPASAFSRHREYRADKGAALLTGATPMIEALRKIDAHYHPGPDADSFAMAKINNKRKVSLFDTHPSIEARIQRLQNL